MAKRISLASLLQPLLLYHLRTTLPGIVVVVVVGPKSLWLGCGVDKKNVIWQRASRVAGNLNGFSWRWEGGWWGGGFGNWKLERRKRVRWRVRRKEEKSEGKGGRERKGMNLRQGTWALCGRVHLGWFRWMAASPGVLLRVVTDYLIYCPCSVCERCILRRATSAFVPLCTCKDLELCLCAQVLYAHNIKHEIVVIFLYSLSLPHTSASLATTWTGQAPTFTYIQDWRTDRKAEGQTNRQASQHLSLGAHTPRVTAASGPRGAPLWAEARLQFSHNRQRWWSGEYDILCPSGGTGKSWTSSHGGWRDGPASRRAWQTAATLTPIGSCCASLGRREPRPGS